MNQLRQETQDPRKEFAKRLEKIEALPQMQRWRAIKDLLFSVKPEFKPIDDQFIQAIREEREHEMLNEFGSSKSGSTRKLYSMPQYLYAALHLMDPEFTALQESPDTSKATNLKIARTFPEYVTARKI